MSPPQVPAGLLSRQSTIVPKLPTHKKIYNNFIYPTMDASLRRHLKGKQTLKYPAQSDIG